jgi:hypothetical protein
LFFIATNAFNLSLERASIFIECLRPFAREDFDFHFHECHWPFAREGFDFHFWSEAKRRQAFLPSAACAHLFLSTICDMHWWQPLFDPKRVVASELLSPFRVRIFLRGSLFIFRKGLHRIPVSLKTSHLQWPWWPPWRLPPWGRVCRSLVTFLVYNG